MKSNHELNLFLHCLRAQTSLWLPSSDISLWICIHDKLLLRDPRVPWVGTLSTLKKFEKNWLFRAKSSHLLYLFFFSEHNLFRSLAMFRTMPETWLIILLIVHTPQRFQIHRTVSKNSKSIFLHATPVESACPWSAAVLRHPTCARRPRSLATRSSRISSDLLNFPYWTKKSWDSKPLT